MKTIIRAYKYRLLPRKAQHTRLVAAVDHTRDLYNAALEERIGCYRLTGKSIFYSAQSRGLTELRKDEAFREFPNSMQRWPLQKLDAAFKSFFRRAKAGEKPGFPRFRSKALYKSFGFTSKQSDGWKLSGPRLYMMGIGRVRVQLHRPLPSPPISCTVRRETSGWFAIFICEIHAPDVAEGPRAIGIDLGITAFAALSDGTLIPGFRAARRAHKMTSRLQRALSRCKRGTKNRNKAKERLARCLERTASARRTFQHQTAARIVNAYDVIGMENLNVKGLARGILSRDVHDAGWASFTKMISDKAEKAGRLVVKVDAKNTSQSCSGCGVIVPKALSVRTHDCPDCGLVLDRDVNAARNVLRKAVASLGALNLEVA